MYASLAPKVNFSLDPVLQFATIDPPSLKTSTYSSSVQGKEKLKTKKMY
jgi:hypothetical protein